MSSTVDSPASAPSVCILSSVHLCYDVRMFQAEARTLARDGIPVAVIALADGTESETDGIRVIPVPRPANRCQRVLRTVAIVRLARRQRARVYAFHDPELLPAVLLLKLFTGSRLVYDVHEDVPAAIRGRTWLPRALRRPVARLYRLLERLALPFVDALTLADHAYRKYYPGHRTLTVLNYPLMTYAGLYRDRPPDPDHRPTLVYSGSITALRGLFGMLQLVHRLKPAHPDLLLLLVGPVGSPAEEAHAWELIAHYGIAANVQLTGLVSHPEVHRRILEADVGLALLHPDPNYVESLPTKMFEYMMMGRPVVVSDFPLWRGIVEQAQCGFAVDPGDLAAAAAAVHRLLDDGELRGRLGRQGRDAVLRTYNWDAEGRRLIELYRSLLAD